MKTVIFVFFPTFQTDFPDVVFMNIVWLAILKTAA